MSCWNLVLCIMFTCCVTCSGRKPVRFLTCLCNFGGGFVATSFSPPLACLLHYFYHNIQWGRWFTYLHMYSCQLAYCLYLCAHALHATAARHWPAADPVSDLVSPFCCRVTVGDVTAAVFKLRARFLNISHVRRCWIKIDSAVNLGQKSSSEFRQCVLWVIRLTKTVSRSAVRAVRHTVTLPRAVWQTIRSLLSVRVLSATTTDAGHRRPFAACPMTPVEPFPSVPFTTLCA